MKTFSYLGLVCLVVLHTLAPSTFAQSNSIVRFVVTYGGIGVQDFEVELFDADKPVTVSNFLWHAQSGRYNNSILQYCESNAVVQGGFGTVDDPLDPIPFSRLYRIPTGRAITNEFFVGTRYTNIFGTLSMALDSDQFGNKLRNSATASWLFNLGNRNVATNLDAQRYTVFGRVTSSSGTNAMHYFNSLSALNRVLNTTNITCSRLVLYPDTLSLILSRLPLGPLGSATCPLYTDLFAVQVLMISAPDVVSPPLTLINPAANFITTNGFAPVSGTVSDNVAISNLFVEVNGDAFPTITTNSGAFSTTLSNLTAGTNIVVVKAYDTSGNLTEVTRRIVHRAFQPISLTTVGSGRITGAISNQWLEVGRDYTIVAKPDKGHLFGSWSDGTNSFNPTLRFRMQTNLAFTATFGTNLFPGVQGTYNGLFYDADTNGIQQASSGYITLKVGSSGSTSGKILLNGKSYSVKGTLNAFGVGEFTVLRKGTNSFFLDDLAIDLTGTNSQLTGTLSEVATTGTVWTAQIVTDHAWFNGKDRIAPQAGKYTVILPADTNNLASMGDGFGAVTVTTKGGVSLAGTLADGTKISQKTTLSKNGQWPLYVPLYKGKGSLISWVNFTNEATTDLRGDFNWFKQTQVAKYYAGGFTNEATLLGSSYVPPGASNAVLQLTNATIAFTNGNLAADFRNDFDVDRNGKTFDQIVTNKLKLSINKSSGLFTGSVIPPGTNRAMKFQGALLQKQTNGSGFFLGTNTSGRVNIEAR